MSDFRSSSNKRQKGTLALRTLRRPTVGTLKQFFVGAELDDAQLSIAEEGGLSGLLNLLQFDNAKIRVLAQQTIRNLVRGEKEEPAIVTENGIAPLRDLLTFKNEDIQKEACWTLAILAENSTTADNIVFEIGWKNIMKLTKSDNAEILAAVATLLANLALHPQHQEAIIKEEGLTALLAMSNNEKISVKRASVQALANLALEAENSPHLLSAGVLGLIVSLLRSDDLELLSGAVHALANITATETTACDDAARRLLVGEDTIAPLVAMVAKPPSKDSVVQKGAAMALAHVACLSDEVPAKLSKLGAIEPIILLGKSSDDTEAQLAVAIALNNLARDAGTREQIRSKGAVGLLKSLARSGDADLRREASEALTELGETISALPEDDVDGVDAENDREETEEERRIEFKLLRERGVPIKQRVTNRYKLIRKQSVAAPVSGTPPVSSIPVIDDAKSTPAAPGTTPPKEQDVVLPRQPPSQPPVVMATSPVGAQAQEPPKRTTPIEVATEASSAQQPTVAALPATTTIAAASDNKANWRKSTVVTVAEGDEATTIEYEIDYDVIIAKLKPPVDSVKQREALEMLSVLCKTPKRRKELGLYGIVPHLVPLLMSPDVDVVKAVLKILEELARNVQNKELQRECGAVELLLGLLSEKDSKKEKSKQSKPRTQEETEAVTIGALDVLCMLCLDSVKSQNAVRDAKGLQLIVGLVSGKDAIKARAARTLGAVCRNNRKLQQQVKKLGVIPKIIKVISEGDDVVRRNAAGALVSIVGTEYDIQNVVRSKGGIAPVVALLTSEAAAVREVGLATIRALAKGNPKNQTAFREARVAAALLPCMSDREDKVKMQALSALMEMTRENPKNCEYFAASPGIIEAVVAALTSTNDTVLYHAQGCVWCMARKSDKRKEAFIAAGAMEPLVKSRNSPNEQVRKGAEWSLGVLEGRTEREHPPAKK